MSSSKELFFAVMKAADVVRQEEQINSILVDAWNGNYQSFSLVLGIALTPVSMNSSINCQRGMRMQDIAHLVCIKCGQMIYVNME
jgi:hypothetical protein